MSDLGYCPECSAPGVVRFVLLGQVKCLNGHRHDAEKFNPPVPPRPRESTIEDYFKRAVRESGGETRKVKWPGVDGAPDRMAGWQFRGRNAFVELKRPGGVAEAHQLREHRKLRAMGFRVDVLDTKEAIDAWVAEMTA